MILRIIVVKNSDEMKYSETIATLKKMGEITKDRKQIIQLEDVAVYSGDYLVDETVKIYICDADMSKVVDKSIKQIK